MEVASAHLTVDVTADGHSVLDQARSMLQDRHGIAHATIQIEPEDHKGCDEVAW
jgi:cobalt-zinc-cadmium efflux system protein